jgi:hypothetical protein
MPILLRIFIVLLVAVPCTSAYAASAGEMSYNSTTKRYTFFDGLILRNIGISTTLFSCTGDGKMEYDTLLNSYKYCNGTVWVLMVGIPTLTPCTKTAAIDFFNSSYHYCNGIVWVNIRQ